ncbi:MAG: hypothetical protein GKR90_22510 [Pseudomonadales bacterium]|nr:hypothetical protein [Pseudomonadales bacterium]
MISCTCVVQEGQTPDVQKKSITRLLNRFSSDAFGEEALITWIPVAPGNGFTAAKPSSSSVISVIANEPLSPERRESLLRKLAHLWSAETGCTLDEVVAVLADPQTH